MIKIIKSLFFALAFMLFFAGVVGAFSTLSVRLEQPKSPTNQRDFDITFVALDTQNNPVSVQCFKKSPSDGGFSQFDTTKNLSNGGNTDTCHVDSGIENTDGTYAFYVVANNGATTATSNTVTVDLNTNGPGTPTNYSKDHPNSCQYIIKFRTADDSGKTVKVEIYRSTTTTLTADNGSRITSISTGSNNDISYTDNVPSCGTTYFYAVRAFDSAGNGSGIVGDSELTSVTTTTSAQGTTPAPTHSTSSGQAGGAIPVTTSGVTPGSGENPTGTVSTAPTESVLGATKAPSQTPSGLGSFFASKKNLFFLFVVLAAVGSAIWFYRSRNS